MGTPVDKLVPNEVSEFFGSDLGKLATGSAAGGVGGATGAALATGNDISQGATLDALGLGAGMGISALTAPSAAASAPSALAGGGGGATGAALGTGSDILQGAGAFDALGLGAGARSALNMSNQVTGAAAAPPTGGITTPAASTVGSTPTAASRVPSVVGPATGAAQGGGFIDSLLQQMKQNALGLGLIGGSMLLAGRTPDLPSEAQLQGLSGEAQATANQLLAQYRAGQLSASQQAGLDQLTQQTKNQVTQYFASIGQADSTAHQQALAQVDQQAFGMRQQMLDNMLTQGLNAIGVAAGPLQTIAQYQLGQDQALRQAYGNFAQGVGFLFGRNAGTPQQQPPQQPRPTQPTQTVQSATQ